jgi:ABC-type oligopeptide transport system ATPase subunit
MTPPTPLLRIDNLEKHFPVQKNFFEQLQLREGRIRRIRQLVHAVNGVSLTIDRGETLALVGESGCGKSTLAKTIIGLHAPTSGTIWYGDEEIGGLNRSDRRRYQKHIQIVFQDPFSSLNPRKKVMEIVGRPMLVHGIAKGRAVRQNVLDLLAKVGLDPDYADRYPHQFSGGQRQRIGIARALACSPELIIADEPISALDVSIQAQILNLMMDLQDEFALTYLFVSHDLSVVKHISTRVAVMYLGFIVETADTDSIFAGPNHPYTQLLFSAIPTLTTWRSRKPAPWKERFRPPSTCRRDAPFTRAAPRRWTAVKRNCPRSRKFTRAGHPPVTSTTGTTRPDLAARGGNCGHSH